MSDNRRPPVRREPREWDDSRMRQRPPQRRPSNQAQRRRAQRRRRKTNVQATVVLAILSVLLLVILYNAVRLSAVLGVGTQRYYDGVYVLGINMNGYTYENGGEMLHEKLNEWENRQFRLSYQERSWTFRAADFGTTMNVDTAMMQAWNFGHTGNIFARKRQIESLRENPIYISCDVTYDEAAVDEYIENIRREIDLEPVDAEIVMGTERPEILTRSTVGYQLDTEALKAQMIGMLEGSSPSDTAQLPVKTLQPTVDSSAAAGGIDLVVEWSTDTSSSSSTRLHNVALALGKFNCMAIYPGQSISFNEVVGKRTVENGFNEAPEYNGNTVTTGIGGGTCQASSTLYGALLQLGFKIDERHNHHMTVGYTQPSCDAAVNDTGSQDLRFTNDTEHVYYFYTSVDRKTATVRVYGNRPPYKVELSPVVEEENIRNRKIEYEEDLEGKFAYYTDETVLKSQGKGGRRSKLYRVFVDWETGIQVASEMVSNDYYYAQADTYWIGIHPREE